MKRFNTPTLDVDFDELDFLSSMSDEPDVIADLLQEDEFDEIGYYLEQMYA